MAPTTIPDGHPRQDVTPEQGYFPLDRTTLDSADAVLHVNDAATASRFAQRGFRASENDGGE